MILGTCVYDRWKCAHCGFHHDGCHDPAIEEIQLDEVFGAFCAKHAQEITDRVGEGRFDCDASFRLHVCGVA